MRLGKAQKMIELVEKRGGRCRILLLAEKGTQ